MTSLDEIQTLDQLRMACKQNCPFHHISQVGTSKDCNPAEYRLVEKLNLKREGKCIQSVYRAATALVLRSQLGA